MLWLPGSVGSVVVTQGISCSGACGIFLGHQAPPGSQASSRGEAKDSALLSSRDAGLLAWSLLILMSTESVMPSNHLVFHRPLLLGKMLSFWVS